MEETKLVDLGLGPTEQGAINIAEKGWEIQDQPTLGGVLLVGKEEGVTSCREVLTHLLW